MSKNLTLTKPFFNFIFFKISIFVVCKKTWTGKHWVLCLLEYLAFNTVFIWESHFYRPLKRSFKILILIIIIKVLWLSDWVKRNFFDHKEEKKNRREEARATRARFSASQLTFFSFWLVLYFISCFRFLPFQFQHFFFSFCLS